MMEIYNSLMGYSLETEDLVMKQVAIWKKKALITPEKGEKSESKVAKMKEAEFNRGSDGGFSNVVKKIP